MASQVKLCHPSHIPLFSETIRYLIRECGVFSVFSLVVVIAVDAFLKYA